MKIKWIVFGLSLIMFTTTCCGSLANRDGVAPTARQRLLDMLTEINSPAQTTVDYTQAYQDVLNRYNTLIVDGIQNGKLGEGETGVWEATSSLSAREALNRVGYAIRDISGDGVPELVIGGISQQKNSFGYGSEIYALYTYLNGRPRLAFEGWARSRYLWMDEGLFYYQGSNGAMYSIFGVYLLNYTGDELICQDYYFTYEKDSSMASIGFYYNTTGKWNKAVSSELNLSESEFWKIDAALEANVKDIQLTPFSSFNPS